MRRLPALLLLVPGLAAAHEGPVERLLSDADVAPLFAAGPLAAAKAAFDGGDLEAAAQGFAKSKRPEARYLRAQALLRLHRGAEAAAVLGELGGPLAPISDRVTWSLGQALDEAQKPGQAADAYAKVPAASLLWADAQLARARDFDALRNRAKALEALEPILAFPAPADVTRGDPAAEALLLAGRIHAEAKAKDKGELSWARRAFVECWAGHPLSAASRECRDRLASLPKPYDAEPEVADTLRRAEALLDANRNEQAASDLEGILPRLDEAGPGRPLACRARFALGKAYRKERLHVKAIAMLAPVVDKCDDPALQVRALYVLASSASIATPADGIPYYKRLQRDFPDHPFADDALFFAADLEARAGQPDAARKTLTKLIEHYPNGDYRPEALFRRAWLERQAGDVDQALRTLKQLGDEYQDSDPVSYERATYWRARLLAGEGKEHAKEAADLWASVAADFPADYYGQLARTRLAEVDAKRAAALEEAAAPPPAVAGFKYAVGPLGASPHFDAAVLLLRMGLDKAASDELNALDKDAVARAAAVGEGMQPLLLLAELLDRASDHKNAHALMKGAARAALAHKPDAATLRVWQVAYPKAWRDEIKRWAPAAGVPVDLLQALMREESALDPSAISGAGAIGLTQLMLPTANGVAKRLKLKRLSQADLMDGPTNIRIGAAYLGDLLKRFDGSAALALAAYNAGAGAVRAWLKPRAKESLDEFVEEIPVEETRNYVKRVLRSYGAYRLLYGKPGERTLAPSQTLPAVE